MSTIISHERERCGDTSAIFQTEPPISAIETKKAHEIANHIIRLLKIATGQSKMAYSNEKVSTKILTITISRLNQSGVGLVQLVKNDMSKTGYALHIENPYYIRESKQK